MHVLIVKTSSLGDVIHTLPAVTDAVAANPDIRFDWVVEEAFAEIPAWHPAVDQVIPVALRRWRKSPMKAMASGEWKSFKKQLKSRQYDLVIDAQGLMKSALLSVRAKGPRVGLSWSSAREPLSSLFFWRTARIFWDVHAVDRLRLLFAGALDYPIPQGAVDYGLDKAALSDEPRPRTLLFLHGTTWATKHYPEAFWIKLAEFAGLNGYRVLMPWGNQDEQERAERVANAVATVEVLPKLSLEGVAEVIASVDAVVSVDTGLSHLAAALAVPQICLYGATDPGRTGAVGPSQMHLFSRMDCAPCLKRSCRMSDRSLSDPPCFADNMPDKVWGKLQEILA